MPHNRIFHALFRLGANFPIFRFDDFHINLLEILLPHQK